MKEKQEINTAAEKLKLLCSRQEKSEFDVRTKLTEWGFNSNESDLIISGLVSEKFIDDQRYANSFCHDRFTFSGWGEYKIRSALRLKHIPEEVINMAVSQIDEKEYQQLIFNSLLKKKTSIKNETDPYRIKAKLFRFGLSRGFDSAQIMNAIEQIMN